jgi:hypothetical protein
MSEQVSFLPNVENLPGTKFGDGNGDDGKHYWLTPPDLYAVLHAEFKFDFDPCPHPAPEGFDGLTAPWGSSSYVNPPFGSIIHQGKKKGPTAWARKAIGEAQQGKRVVLVYPIDKWILMLLAAGAEVRNLGDVRWYATEDGSVGKGTGRHIAAFILNGEARMEDTDVPVCPHCDHAQRSSSWYSATEGGEGTTTCEGCGKKFRWERCVSVTYTTEPLGDCVDSQDNALK